MADNTIQYSTRNYQEIRDSIIELTRRYYGDVFSSMNDASVGQWLVDVLSDIYDVTTYNIDRSYQETNLDTAQMSSSLKNLARNNGVKVPGPKAAMVEVEISCTLPLNESNVPNSAQNQALADESYAPMVKRGTLFSNGTVTFELAEDVDFRLQFDSRGISNRKIIPARNANGTIVGYRYVKNAIAHACQSKIYRKYLTGNDVVPFMSITLQDTNVLSVDSIIVKQGNHLASDVNIAEFYVDRESYEGKDGKPVLRYFEVDNLVDQYRYGYEDRVQDEQGGFLYYEPIWETVDAIDNGDGTSDPIRLAMRGKWKRVKNKYITEFTDDGSLKITFGPGLRNQYGQIPEDSVLFAQYMMSRMQANDYMGVVPEPNTTIYILYKVGGGEMSNVAANTITNITYLNMDIDGNCLDPMDATKKARVQNSVAVTNPTISYGGKDAPSDEELKYIVRYANAAQNRCVTLWDYYAKIAEIPPQYGCPFRYGVAEENNKVVIYTLGLDYLGKLSSPLSEVVADNIKEYLSKYRMINDVVEIRSGKIINISFDIDIYVDKNYDKTEVSRRVIELVQDYMDVRKHLMGEDIFLGDLEKEISLLDGVQNLISLRCYNKVGNGYSDSETTQSLASNTPCVEQFADYSSTADRRIDLQASDKTLYAESNSMFEIKYPNRDIVVSVKERS